MKPKKNQYLLTSNILPEKLKLELNIILQSKHRGAALKRLPYLFDSLSSVEKTSKLLTKLQDELNEIDHSYYLQRQEAIRWLEEKITLLRHSKWSQHPTVKHKIQSVEDAIKVRFFNPLMDVILNIWNLFKEAVWAVVAFGQDSLFENWVKIDTYFFGCHEIDKLPFLPNTNSDDERWKLSLELSRGFVSFEFLPNNLIRFFEGRVIEIVCPECVELMLTGNQSMKDWQENSISDPVKLLAYLKFCSLYSSYKRGTISPLKLPLDNPPTTFDEADKMQKHGCLVYNLSRFDSKNSPLSLDELKNLVVTFLAMLGTSIDEGSINECYKMKRKSRDEARVRDAEKAKKWMKENWRDWKISHSTMASRCSLAIGRGELSLENNYTSQTFEDWASQIDPWPTDIRKKRPRTKNLKS